MFYSTDRFVGGRHYSSIESNPKPLPAARLVLAIIGQCSSNLMNILTICPYVFSGNVSPRFALLIASAAQKQDL
jgi:hypothetical protein